MTDGGSYKVVWRDVLSLELSGCTAQGNVIAPAVHGCVPGMGKAMLGGEGGRIGVIEKDMKGSGQFLGMPLGGQVETVSLHERGAGKEQRVA